MAPNPEQQARITIDALLSAAGWVVQDYRAANLAAGRGLALREFELANGYGTADYLLYLDGKAAGVIEAKKQGATLTGVEYQSARYAQGLSPALPAWRRPLPFLYESTGTETHFTQGISSEDTMFSRLQAMPSLVTERDDYKLWPAQITAIHNLEKSLAASKPRALIGLTAAPNKQIFGFFSQNLVMDYGHPQAVADGVNVSCDGYRIKTEVSEGGRPWKPAAGCKCCTSPFRCMFAVRSLGPGEWVACHPKSQRR